MKTLVNYAVLSDTTELTNNKESKKLLSDLYKKTNWQSNTISDTLENVIGLDKLVTIKTDCVTVIDFDTDEGFNRALEFNSHLNETHQCQFIVKSLRKGGHFYYLPNPSIQEPFGHTKQSALDILTSEKHNAIAPTKKDKGKVIVHQGTKLTEYNKSIDALIQLLVLENLPTQSRAMALHTSERYSDDAVDFVKSYISNMVLQEQFDEFYNVPNPIPPGLSNEVYLSLSTRLGSDETVSKEDYISAMVKFNHFHDRKTDEELRSEIMQRMLSGANKLWRHDPNKATETFTAQHRMYKTKISVYYDMNNAVYILHYLDRQGRATLHTTRNVQQYLELAEKIMVTRRDNIRRKTGDVTAVTTVNDYTIAPGYHHRTSVFNKAYVNDNLKAFSGAKPQDYKYPGELIELCRYMWGDEYDYLLSTTKHRYSTFQFSPVVTFLKGTEGSGKDLTVALLTAGFSQKPQNLSYALLKDKHASWQTEENVIFSEIGSWKSFEQSDLLAELKSISGSNGQVTFRDMQRTAQVVPTLVKIWITSNEWIKLHTDPVTQRRLHIVYMPHPLEIESGGKYTTFDLQRILAPSAILNFYYWLGNEYEHSEFTADHYKNSKSRQHSEAYQLYTDATQDKSDAVAVMLWSQHWDQFKEAMSIYNLGLEDLDYKYSKSKHLVLAVPRLKEAFSRRGGGNVIHKILDRISAEKEGNKRLMFNKKVVEKYITIYGAPEDSSGATPLNEGEEIEL